MRISYPDFVVEAAQARAALLALSKTVDDSGLDKALTELVKVRASQINGCAFCLQLHLDAARKAGVADVKLDLVAVWRETEAFGEREKAALGWTEALIERADETLRAKAAEALDKVFSRSEILNLTIAIGTIDQWNRIAVGLGFRPLRE